MKSAKIFTLVILTSLYALSQNLHLGGYLQTYDRVRLKKGEISWQEYRLDLKGEARLDNVNFFSEIWVRSWGNIDKTNIQDLTDKNKVSPWDIDIREAYADIKGFIFSNLDLRIGRQRIAWGTADRLNPTDNLNPDDLEDIWDFGRHLGSNAIKVSIYFGKFNLSGAFIPSFTPAVLPKGDWLEAFISSEEFGFPRLSNFKIFTTYQLPEKRISESSSFGVRLKAENLGGFDLSVSYYQGRDDLPLPKTVTVKSDTINVNLIFPKIKVFGFDLAGDIAGVGIWAEAGLFSPEEIKMQILPFNNQITVLKKENYARYVFGFDYTFKNGTYINLQYLHGFIHERGRENLKDYIVGTVEYKTLGDKLKLELLKGGAEFKKLAKLTENWAIIFNPEITYTPYDNFELCLGLRLIESRGTTTFGRFRDRDEIYLRAKYSF